MSARRLCNATYSVLPRPSLLWALASETFIVDGNNDGELSAMVTDVILG